MVGKQIWDGTSFKDFLAHWKIAIYREKDFADYDTCGAHRLKFLVADGQHMNTVEGPPCRMTESYWDTNDDEYHPCW